MKPISIIYFLLVLFCFNACSQNRTAISIPNSGELDIDKNLEHHLFDFLPYGVRGDPNSGIDIEFVSNALIFNQSSDRVPAFDTCRSFFVLDTLIIEFRYMTPFVTDIIWVKIKSRRFRAYLVNEEGGIEVIGEPKTLILKDKIKRKGQEIFGKLSLDFYDRKQNKTNSYEGAFRCKIE